MPFRFLFCSIEFYAALAILPSIDALAESRKALESSLYHNAFIAAQDLDYTSVMQHWFLFYNIAQSTDHQREPGNFQSLVWASINALDLCPENVPLDTKGDKIWPLVLHNYIVRHKQDPEPSARKLIEGSEAFKLGYQQRQVGFHEFLSPAEIRSLKFQKFGCSAIDKSARWISPNLKLTEPQHKLTVLSQLLQTARLTWNTGDAARLLDARVFALQMALNQDEKDAAKQEAFVTHLGAFSAEGYARLEDETKHYIPQLIAKSSLSTSQKQSLLTHWLDQAIDREEGQQVSHIISLMDKVEPKSRALIWSAPRGDLLIELSKKSAFGEGPTIAFYQGMAAYKSGKTQDALRLFALSLSLKPESADLRKTALNWLKYILLQYKFEAKYVTFLRDYLPVSIFKSMAQDLVWVSAFYGEPYVLVSPDTRDLLGYKLNALKEKLLLLARGRETKFMESLQAELNLEPRKTIQFMQQMSEQLAKQSNRIIQQFIPTLAGMNALLRAMDARQRSKKNVTDLQLLLDSLIVQQGNFDPQQLGRQLRTGVTVSLGTVALEPTDTLPWPFPLMDDVQLSVLREIKLEARYLKDSAIDKRYTWRIGEK